MDSEQEQVSSVVIRVTHIRDGEVLDVIDTPAGEFKFEMQETEDGSNQ